MALKTLLSLCLAAGCLCIAQKYDGPVPPKADLPFLMHGGNLLETEAAEARQENRKNDLTYVVSGAASPARTPLAEPIFIIDAQKVSPERFELYRFDVRNGAREVTMSAKNRKGGTRPLHLSVTPLGNHLFRIEANEPLENGEYGLSPSGDNRVFCFQVY